MRARLFTAGDSLVAEIEIPFRPEVIVWGNRAFVPYALQPSHCLAFHEAFAYLVPPSVEDAGSKEKKDGIAG